MIINQQIQVIVDPDAKTLKFIDNGIGMTADEVEEYITSDRFFRCNTSFLRNIRTKQQMIRSSVILDWDSILHLWLQMKYILIHFLIKKEQQPVHWTCDGGTEYDMQDGDQNILSVQRLHCS